MAENSLAEINSSRQYSSPTKPSTTASGGNGLKARKLNTVNAWN
jgi:hypothetical protein